MVDGEEVVEVGEGVCLLEMTDMPGGGGTSLPSPHLHCSQCSLLAALLHFKVTKLAGGGPANTGDNSLSHSQSQLTFNTFKVVTLLLNKNPSQTPITSYLGVLPGCCFFNGFLLPEDNSR